MIEIGVVMVSKIRCYLWVRLRFLVIFGVSRGVVIVVAGKMR